MAAIEVFISYAHEDEELKNELESQLEVLQRHKVIKVWHDRRIRGGEKWRRNIDLNLQRARIILLLVSADFMASEFCWNEEVPKALERERSGSATVVPVILKECGWESTPLHELQAVPKDGEPVTSWENRVEAFEGIAEEIEKIALELAERDAETAQKLPVGGKIKKLLYSAGPKSLSYGLLALLMVAFLIHGFSAHRVATHFLEQADFSKANRYLRLAKWTAFYNTKIAGILDVMNRPLRPETYLIVKGVDGSEQKYPFAKGSRSDRVLGPEDNFKLSISQTDGTAYLYIFQTDLHYGYIQQLFPNLKLSPASNPIESHLTYTVPAKQADWFYLEEPADGSSVGTTKTIHLMISPWRDKDIENQYDEIYQMAHGNNTAGERRKKMIEDFISKLSFRKESGIQSLYYEKMVFIRE